MPRLNAIPCPKCGKKMLKRQEHPHALGHYTGNIVCRGCNCVMNEDKLFRFVAKLNTINSGQPEKG